MFCQIPILANSSQGIMRQVKLGIMSSLAPQPPVSAIVNHRKTGNNWEFLVKFVSDDPDSSGTWMLHDQIHNQLAIQDYCTRRGIQPPKDLSRGG